MSNVKFKQPESFKELSFDPDEIPGITTFIYRENRFREPHEFVNAWRWEQKSIDIKKSLGLAHDVGPEDLCEIIKSQQEDLQEVTLESRTKSNLIDDLHKEIDTKKNEVTFFRKELQSQHEAREKTDKENRELKELLSKYGTHSSDCNWVIMLQSGRLHDTEDEQCDCGWLERQL